MPPLAKRLDKKQTRGGGLRVGRVVSEIRNGRDDEANSNQLSSASAPSLRDDEQRIQLDMIEMLTLKLAKKERENELLRVQQKALDEARTCFESESEQLRASAAATTTELTDANQQLQRQLQLLQIQCERMRADGDARNAAALEVKRLREKEQQAARALDRERQSTIEQLQRDVRQCAADRSALDAKIVAALNQQQALSDQINQLEAKNLALDESLRAERELRKQLERKLAVSALDLDQEQRVRASLELELQRIGHEKQALEEKHRLLNKTIKDANVKAVDADKKRLELARSEDQLAATIAQLRRDNDELKMRRGQMTSQAKHLSAKVAQLETTSESLQRKLTDALDEIESARKCSREYQFRIKQLQEELVFQEKRKRVDATASSQALPSEAPAAAVPVQLPSTLEAPESCAQSSAVAPAPPAPASSTTTEPQCVHSSESDTGVPSWMKD